MASPDLLQLGDQLGQRLLARGWRVSAAESCTGGGIAAAITAIAGSSQWFECGIVSYANAAKHKLLQVSEQTLATEGAVSEPVVQQMLAGVLALSGSNIAVAVSGIAGPSGGSPEKPVGTVWFAWGLATGQVRTQCMQFHGDRQAIQRQAVVHGLQGLLSFL